MDPNPYNKDNETNWVNWNELKQNEDLVRFYKKLIKIRKENASLRNKDYTTLEFIEFINRCKNYESIDGFLKPKFFNDCYKKKGQFISGPLKNLFFTKYLNFK